MNKTAHDQSCHSHLVQYSMKTYAAVAVELHAILKFGAWLTVSSELHAAAVEHPETQARYSLHLLRWMYAVCEKKCTAGSNLSCSDRSLATE